VRVSSNVYGEQVLKGVRMRRAVVALLGTAAGTVLLVGAKAGGGFGLATTPQAHGAPARETPTTGEPSTAAPPVAAPTVPGKTTSPTPGTRTTTTAPPPTRPTTRPPNRGGGLRDGSFDGAPIFTEWGPVEVRIVVAGGKITDVVALQTPNEHSRSVQINQRAVPILRQEALQAQSASIDTVSGASVTSDGYRESLQSAIDAARG
jgi:uncharacterized protein with FMN-binding domain